MSMASASVRDRGGAELIAAANRGEVEQVAALLESGVPANSANKAGATALHRAAYQNHLEVVQVLVEAGANLEQTDYAFASTPLHEACISGALAVVEYIVARDGDWKTRRMILLQNKAGRTPLDLAEEQAKVPVINLMKRLNAEDVAAAAHHKKLCLAMHVAAKQAKAEEVSRLLQEGVDANWAPLRGRSAIVECAERNHVAVMQVLVEHRAELNAPDATGSTALMVAARYGATAAAQYLLREGADDSRVDDFGKTARDIAMDWDKRGVKLALVMTMAGRVDPDAPIAMGRGPAPHGQTHQRWSSQAREQNVGEGAKFGAGFTSVSTAVCRGLGLIWGLFLAGFLIEDGTLPSDVGPRVWTPQVNHHFKYKSIILNTKSIILNTKFIVFN